MIPAHSQSADYRAGRGLTGEGGATHRWATQVREGEGPGTGESGEELDKGESGE